MKYRTSLYVLLALLLIALGGIWFFYAWEAQAPAQVFPATVDRDCAPWDGSAFTVSIPLSDTSTISISIYRSPDIKLPSSYSFSDETMSEGHAYLLLPDGLPEQLAGGCGSSAWRRGYPSKAASSSEPRQVSSSKGNLLPNGEMKSFTADEDRREQVSLHCQFHYPSLSPQYGKPLGEITILQPLIIESVLHFG